MRTKVTEDQFVGQSFYVGIDYHKESWQVTILGQNYEHKTMSQNPDPYLLASYLKRNFPGANYRAVYEAGFSGFQSCRIMRQLGIDCIVVHPADVPTNERERLQKTDKVDSRKLARSLRNLELKGIDIPPRCLEADRALIRQRYRLMKDISRIKNRVKSLLFQFAIDIPTGFTSAQSRHWSKKYLDWLKHLSVEEFSLRQTIDNYVRTGEILRKELLLVHSQIRSLSRSADYSNGYRLLTSLPGIGLLAAMTLLVQLGDIRRFSTLDELCNYVGLVPRMHSSGDRVHVGKLTSRGKKELKVILVEASWIAIRHDPALMFKFNELTKRMTKHKAIIRIARKLLSRIRWVLQNGIEYQLGVLD